ncbi:hypothetical protein ACSMX9_22710 [Streptomyces sp. LE64]|uniref:hypothetical protein n=1 Tax=Streptomyces sp. LE64 TaxID=3448653 RepID=UPI0040418198
MSPTPKSARSYHRKPASGDRTRNTRSYQVVITWPGRAEQPTVLTGQDRPRLERSARIFANQGARVTLHRRAGYAWREVAVYDTLAEAARADDARRAEREAAEWARHAAESAQRRIREAEADEQNRAAVERLMTRPPVPRGQQAPARTGRARHTSGGRP